MAVVGHKIGLHDPILLFPKEETKDLKVTKAKAPNAPAPITN
jgi:hypothetical protein